MPAAFGGSGLAQMQMAATLVGLEVPSRTRNLELKPYALGSTTTDLTSATPFRNDATGDVGLDVKYGDVQVLWDVSLKVGAGEVVAEEAAVRRPGAVERGGHLPAPLAAAARPGNAKTDSEQGLRLPNGRRL